MKKRKLNPEIKAEEKNQSAEAKSALSKLRKLKIQRVTKENQGKGLSDLETIKLIQKENSLSVSGKLTKETVKVINDEFSHQYVMGNKSRVAKLQTLLGKLNVKITPEEKKQRIAGDSTINAIKKIQKSNKLDVTGKVTEEFIDVVEKKVIKERLKSKTQRGNLLSTLNKVNKIANLNIEVDPNEILEKNIGASSKKLIKAFQKKYNLKATGVIDKTTLDKISSVAASKGRFVKIIKKPKVNKLEPVNKKVRLNMISQEVNKAQKTLSYLGYKISEKEFNTQTFGKTTIKAVQELQKARGLAQTGQVDSATLKVLNEVVKVSNPLSTGEHRYRVRGSVRDEFWNRKNNMIVKIFEKILDKESEEPLAAKKVFLNGFFDLPYIAPINPINGKIKENFHLQVKLFTNADQVNPVAVQTHYNVKPIHWVNFTENRNEDGAIEYNGKYNGKSAFEISYAIIQKAIGISKITDFHETESDKQITQLSLQTGLSTDEIMRIVLSALVELSVKVPKTLTKEVFYAFIRQNQPTELPGDLLRGTSDWETINQLVELTASGIIFLNEETQTQIINNALDLNLISQFTKVNINRIITELENQRINFALSKPILTGNANLRSLLELSTNLVKDDYQLIASVFVKNNGINTDFWKDIKELQSEIGEAKVKDFIMTVELGNISKNHEPFISYFKKNIGTEPEKPYNSASDIAKLTVEEIKDVINQNNISLPTNIPGESNEKKVQYYASAINGRSEFLFPSVAVIAEIKRGGSRDENLIQEAEKFIDTNKELDFKNQYLDKYLLDNKIEVEESVLNELKIIQRLYKIETNAGAVNALIKEGFHSTLEVYYAGSERIKKVMSDNNISTKYAGSVYEMSKMRYMQILARLMDFRREANIDTPKAIIPQVYEKSEIQKVLGDIPNLEILFGSMDFCDCKHCKSLYSPAAYLTDMLRFLKEHDSLIIQGGKTLTVKDILFDRRPDIGNIKLNCENTNTALPYIDLVCEILENNLDPQLKDFNYQTTLSQKELLAMPQHIRPHAYTILADANYPIYNSFSLAQEETRTFLDFLRVPRIELMEAFQDRTSSTKVPDDSKIAAEYFGLSAKEYNLIRTKRATAGEQDVFWNIDTTQSTLPVSVFLERTNLSYNQMLELLMVRFVNNPDVSPRMEIDRTTSLCDTEQQNIINLSIERFDLLHRFFRLWKNSGWEMWELDLLLRNSKIGINKLNDDTLTKLKKFKQLQDKLKLKCENLLAFYGEINREVRINPVNPELNIQPLYNKLFQNQAVSNPVDINFEAINNSFQPIALNSGIVFGKNTAPFENYSPVPTILSALSLRQTEFDLLIEKTDNIFTVESLSVLLRYGYLAKSLKLSIKDLFLFLGIINSENPFITLDETLSCIEQLENIKASGLSLSQLDYVLNFNIDSPVGLRNKSFINIIQSLRTILKTNKEKIEQLALTVTNRTNLLAFDAEALDSMTDSQIVAAVAPYVDMLEPLIENFKEAAFSVQEINTIVFFDTLNISTESKTSLINNFTSLQSNLDDLLNQNKNQIKSQVASTFGIQNGQAAILLEDLMYFSGTQSLLTILENESLLAKDTDGNYTEINTINYPQIFEVYNLLHKISVLILNMSIDSSDLKWFITNFEPISTLSFAALPVNNSVTGNDYEGWLNLFLFLKFKSGFPEPEDASIRSILDLAIDSNGSKEHIIDEIVKLTQWKKEDLVSLDTGLKLLPSDADWNSSSVDTRDYLKASTYQRISKCMEQIQLIGIEAVSMFNWANINMDHTEELKITVQVRQAVKSKYEQDDWLQKVTPIYDTIREKKRTALVNYLIEHSQRTEPLKVTVGGKQIPNPLYWNDSNALFKYFLIDVEMSSCQLTSRMKQALSSVQLFVQRCFLNLENRYVQVTQDQKEDKSSPNAWSQWRWMKNYRIWEVNRKIFFYPENWLEPELRDDKSPFFKELENELKQNENTKENVEEAFKNYLYKADEVSHLEVCGFYHQMEDLDPAEIGYETNIVHVIGRTKSMPNVYYYRTYDMNYSSWGSWEKIDIDIAGDHVIPVVYNRKLYLFWLEFIEKPMKSKKVPEAKASNSPTDAPEPRKVLEIQLGWSIKKSGGWTSKKVSKQKLIHPWERPLHSYNLKPYYLAKFNELYLDIYITTSKGFNNTKFYDPTKKMDPNSSSDYFKNPTYLTKNRFNETFLPWHSSSFVFNGEVKDVKLKGLGGMYCEGFWSSFDSYNYVNSNFGVDGEKIKELDPKYEYGPRLKLPEGMHFSNTRLTNNRKTGKNDKTLRVLAGNSNVSLLNNANSPFELVITQQDLQLNTMSTDHPLFYQDNQRAFFIKPEWENRLNSYGQLLSSTRKYRFMPFYHPYTLLFIRELNRDGVDGLLNRSIQTKPATYAPKNDFNFSSYSPSSKVIVGDDDKTAQKYHDVVDFSFGGANSIYNWEMFFHAPLMIACNLMQNQKFEDAMTWFHYIFDPTNIDNYPTPQRYWITKPFFNYNSDDYRKQRIESILDNLDLKENENQLKAWRNNPFKPHVIARYRPVAYQKNVVMKYIDNLIAWGDMLFKRDTIESINEASLLYVLAYEILGDRPKKVPNTNHEELSFNELETKLDDFGNARVDLVIEDTLLPVNYTTSTSDSGSIPKLETLYFCIPSNSFMSKYWDTVEDRLFKIRNCMNIAGIVRKLPLFEPPIDPALLVKAAASGMDISSVLNDVNAPTPYYRFKIIVQKAIEFCNEVKALGDKLLSALEKKDGETLSLLKSQHEIQLLEAVKEIRKKQIDEADENIKNLEKASEMAVTKYAYYSEKEFMNAAETVAVGLNSASLVLDVAIATGYLLSGGLKLIPSFLAGAAGFGGSPEVSATMGGQQIGNGAEMAVRTIQSIASALDKAASLSTTIGSYQRRKDDWDFQASLARIEENQIDYQINAAKIRLAIAEKELENQELQIDNVKEVDDYMKNKFTGEQLYRWMVTQISTVYFQAYQLAFDMAKRAEKCYQYELGLSTSNIIQFGYWDSLKKGLLSGEKLMIDLRKLEAEYINQNRREFEITKHISLAQMSPLSLITLKETGKCKISLPEWIFDMDYPGHYMRRIKNVSISIPCVVGPNTGVNCTLTLLKNEIRIESILEGGKYEKHEVDSRFRTMFGSIASITTSSAQNDNGMFELNFNDERYLPFEGAGVISDWEINMPIENNYFDFNSLSDVVMHISYTSRNGGQTLATAANLIVQSNIPTETARLFSLKQLFSSEWHKFLYPEGGVEQELVAFLKEEHYPFFIRGQLSSLKIKKIELFAETSLTESFSYEADIKVTNSDWLIGLHIDRETELNDVHHLSQEFSPGGEPASLGELRLKLKKGTATDFISLTDTEIDNIYLLVYLG